MLKVVVLTLIILFSVDIIDFVSRFVNSGYIELKEIYMIFVGESKHNQFNKDRLASVSKTNQETQSFERLKTLYQEVSPNGKKIVAMYEVPFDEKIHGNYNRYLSGNLMMTVKDISSGREEYLFVGDFGTYHPHWLGNDHIYFAHGCGTGCQALYLVDMYKGVKTGLISYMPPDEKGIYKTHFEDWFGKTFIFNGTYSDPTSEFIDGKVYLTLKRHDDHGQTDEFVKLSFTGKELKLVSENKLHD